MSKDKGHEDKPHEAHAEKPETVEVKVTVEDPDGHAAAAEAAREREGTKLAVPVDWEDLFYDLVEWYRNRASLMPAISGLADVAIHITSVQPSRDVPLNLTLMAIRESCESVRRTQGDHQKDMASWLLMRKVPPKRPTPTQHEHEV